MHNHDIDGLLLICEHIEHSNAEVSVARLRARAPGKLPVATAIEVIKRYRQGARAAGNQPASAPPETSQVNTLDERVSHLEEKIRQLESIVAELVASAKG